MRKKNVERAEFARPAIEIFAKTVGESIEDDGLETVLADLVCDIMHFCDLERVEWAQVLKVAKYHYKAEQDYLTE